MFKPDAPDSPAAFKGRMPKDTAKSDGRNAGFGGGRRISVCRAA